MAATLALLPVALYSQPGAGDPAAVSPSPTLEGLAVLSDVRVLETPPIAVALMQAVIGPAEPYRFADPFEVVVRPTTHGLWETTGDGQTAVWRLRVVSAGSLSLNFGFTRYKMPEGGQLRIHTPDGAQVLGPYTDADNKTHGELWTPLVSGGEAVIEVAVPVGSIGELDLELGSVNRGFRDLGPERVELPDHASCHIDVACSAADPYRDQVRSEAMYTFGGSAACSGALLNNTAGDGKPYFLTAFHCFKHGSLGDPAALTPADFEAASRTLVVYWNYESPTCGARDGLRMQSQSGAYHVASYLATDFALLELEDPPDREHNVYFGGWDRSGAQVASAVGIHQPLKHVKSISFENDPLTVTERLEDTVSVDGKYLRVGDWDGGSVASGSSGSPLFDQNKRVVGQLWGGHSRCGNNSAVWYGRLALSWTGGGTKGTRLSDWLDPGGTGETVIDGRNWNLPPEAVGALDDKALRSADSASTGSVTTDVSYGFLDREGDDLTYTVSSSDQSLVTATVSGSMVTLAPVAAGTATISATATLTTSETGMGATETVTVTVTPLSGGTATITVTATDVDGSNTSARQRFKVVVANRPPVALGTLQPLELRDEGAEARIDAAEGFEDPDGDELIYGAWSSNLAVARVRVHRSSVTVAPREPGAATGDAEDDDGEAVVLSFDSQPPPPPAPSGPPEADFTLTAECAGDLCRARTGLPVTFEDTSTGRVESRRRDFGDETGSRTCG